jgi:hypothetical protein
MILLDRPTRGTTTTINPVEEKAPLVENDFIYIIDDDNEDYSDVNSPDTHNRKKRFAVPFILGSLFSVAVNGVVGWVSGMLHPSLSEAKVQTTFKDVSKVIDQTEHQISRINSTVASLIRAHQQGQAEEEMMFSYQVLSQMARTEMRQVELISNGMLDLLHGKLSPLLVDQNDLKAKFQHIMNTFRQNNASSLLHNYLNLFSLSVSHSFNMDTLSFNIKIIIPGEAKGTCRALYCLIEFPISIQHQELELLLPNYPIIGGDNINAKMSNHNLTSYVVFSAKEQVVAVGQDSLGQLAINGMDSYEIDHCRDIRHLKVCPATHNIIRTGNARKCVEALSSLHGLSKNAAEVEDLKQFCKIRLVGKDEVFIIQVSRTRFHAFFPKPTKMTIYCTNGFHQSVERSGLHRIYLPSGCTAMTKDFEFSGASALTVDFVHLPQSDFNLNHHINVTTAGYLVHVLKQLPSGHSGVLVNEGLDIIKQQSQDLTQSSIGFCSLMIVSGLCVLTGILFPLTWCCKMYPCQMFECPRKSSSVHEKVEDEHELEQLNQEDNTPPRG